MTESTQYRVGGHEQLISNSVRFKPAFAKDIGNMQVMIDLRGIPTKTSLKTSYVPSLGFFKTMGFVQYAAEILCPAIRVCILYASFAD